MFKKVFRRKLAPLAKLVRSNLQQVYILPGRWTVQVCAKINLGLLTYVKLFLCFAPFVSLSSIVLTSLLPLLYVNCEF